MKRIMQMLFGKTKVVDTLRSEAILHAEEDRQLDEARARLARVREDLATIDRRRVQREATNQ